MITIRIKSTGEIKEVERNIAFDLVDRKIAEVVRKEPPRKEPLGYSDRQFRSRHQR